MGQSIETVTAYIETVEPNWRIAYQQVLDVVSQNLPAGFELTMQYGMPTFVVPLSVFPEGYLNRGDEPLPFISLGATKRHVALYHMGLMGNEAVRSWFREAYQEQVSTKLNMGKSCLRFTNPKRIPYELIGELVTKITLEEWLQQYQHYQKKKKNY